VKLTVQERLQFQYLLPVQGSYETLETVERIIEKIKVLDSVEPEREFIFEIADIKFIQNNIRTLDQHQKLPFQALSVIRKIMEEII